MQKVAIVTLYKDNFGSILQAYSTYHYLSTLGYHCDLLEQKWENSFFDKISRLPKLIFKSIRYKDFLKDYLKSKKSSTEDLNLLSTKTKELMNEFVNSNFTITIVDSDHPEKVKDNYDFFITGSDQVWNGYDRFKFLEFADVTKRIAFAPSFGSTVKDYNKANVKKGLMGFDKLSVREESGVKIVRDLTGRDATRLADPTLLLSKIEWKQFSEIGRQEQNYILLHFLNKPNDIAINTINEYLQIHDCDAYCICNNYEEYNKLLRHEFIDIGPHDYVSLIYNASFVFTDSFHSTFFSLNLETKFLTFERQYLHGNSQSSRITDLLNRVDMPECYFKGSYDFDFTQLGTWESARIFDGERMKMKNYLEEMLGRRA